MGLKRRRLIISSVCLGIILCCMSILVLLTKGEEPFKSINQNNTVLMPTDMTESWYETLKVPIDNPKLIETLNKSQYTTAFYTLGVEGSIFLGRWLLTCQIDDIQPVPYFIELTADVLKMDDNILELKKMKHITIEEERELLDVLIYIRPDELDHLTNEVTLDRTMTLQETKVFTSSTRVFISGVNITGQTTTADVYLKIEKNQPHLIVKNIVKAEIDTTWIDEGAFKVMN